MIVLVTGTPGAGKTYYAMRKVAESLEKGKCVVTNVDLRPDVGQLVADHNFFSRLFPGRRRSKGDMYTRSVYVSHSLDDLFAVRLEGTKEGRGVMILDEAHGWMNARTWNDEMREQIVAWFTLHRKLGFDVYLITQDAKNVDRQVRSLAEYEVTLKNLRRFKVMGMPLFPINLFLAVWRWNGIAGTVAKRESYKLGWPKDLYDTHQVMHGVSHSADAGGVVLPRPKEVAQPADLESAYANAEISLEQFAKGLAEASDLPALTADPADEAD